MLHLFPHPLTRTATGSWLDFDALRWVDLPARLATRRALLAQQQQAQTTLDAALYQQIAGLDSAEPTAPLLALKRAVFNGRALPTLPAGLPADLHARLADYAHLHARLAAWERELDAAYAQQLACGRRHLQALSQQPNLRRGLPLASPTLLAQLPRYQHVDPAAPDKRAQQTELGLLRYLTRLHFKTSPFSTFTTVSVSTLADVPAGAAWPAPATPPRSAVRLGSYLLAHLQALLLLVPGVAAALPARLNPTCWEQEEASHFLLNQRNLEAFQRLPTQPLLAVVAQLASPGQLSLRQLAATLAADYVEAPPAALATWLAELVACGFLLVDLNLSPADSDWPIALAQRLSPLAVEFEVVREILDFLAAGRWLLTLYPKADVTTRTNLYQQFNDHFRHLEAQLLAQADPAAVAVGRAAARPTPASPAVAPSALRAGPYLASEIKLLYEDTAQDLGGELSAAGTLTLLRDLHQVLGSQPPGPDELAPLAQFYQQQFGGRPGVALLEFYQAYAARPAPPPAAPAAPWPALHPVLAAALPAYAAVLTLDPAQLPPAASGAAAPWAGAALVQLFASPAAPQLRGVVNNLLPGLGKGSGRFLYLADKELTHAQQTWNQRLLAGRGLATALHDATYSNANLHPPLLPNALSLNGSPAPPGSVPLALADLEVRLTADGCPGLWHAPSGQPVLPCDVDLQAHDTRAELYQFLLRFGPPAPTLAPLLAAVGADCRRRFPAQTEPLPGVFRYPRVQLGAGLVLRRRRWYVAAAALPRRGAAESESQYLVRLTDWQHQLALPDEVFFAAQPATPAASGANPDDHKPQYLHFGSPLLVRLFEKQLRKNLPLRLEEMYPATAQLRQSGQAHVHETLLEWGELSA